MKTLQLTSLILVLFVLGLACSTEGGGGGQSKQEINKAQLQKRGDGLYYAVNTEKPYSGKVVELYKSGQNKEEVSYKNGQLHGQFKRWYSDGQKKDETSYKAGQKAGNYLAWHANGQKKKEGAYKAGKQEGKWVFYYVNGQKQKEGIYKAGQPESAWAYWSRNGEKRETGTMTGNDGKKYQTVKIGSQWWMGENLSETKYRDGSVIPKVTGRSKWSNLKTGAYCTYENKESNVARYGYLYNWYTVKDSRNIAPAGWHVPTDKEWTALTTYLGGKNAAGGKMKATIHWESPNTGANNESGISALPGGYRLGNGLFYGLGDYASFWSSTQSGSNGAWARYLSYDLSVVYRDIDDRHYGFSVRLIRD